MENVTNIAKVKAAKESKKYVLVEMSDGIRDAMENIERVMSNQRQLIDIVNKSDAAENFKEFTAGVEDQIKNLHDQLTRLSMQKAALDDVIKMCETDEKVVKAVDKLIVGFNIQMTC